MSLQDDLYSSALRWAATALIAYATDPPDYDFAVHHMAVAVEHLSKAYLCSVSEVLLVGDRPSVEICSCSLGVATRPVVNGLTSRRSVVPRPSHERNGSLEATAEPRCAAPSP